MQCRGLLSSVIGIAAILMAGSDVTAQDRGGNSSGAVTVFLIEDYPAFNPPATARDGRPTLELRALVFLLPPWSQENAAIILNPVHANAETLSAAMRALRKGIRSGSTRNILVTARSIDPGRHRIMDSSGLSDKLQELQHRPLTEISKLGGRKGRQITIENFVTYLDTQY